MSCLTTTLFASSSLTPSKGATAYCFLTKGCGQSFPGHDCSELVKLSAWCYAAWSLCLPVRHSFLSVHIYMRIYTFKFQLHVQDVVLTL